MSAREKQSANQIPEMDDRGSIGSESKNERSWSPALDNKSSGVVAVPIGTSVANEMSRSSATVLSEKYKYSLTVSSSSFSGSNRCSGSRKRASSSSGSSKSANNAGTCRANYFRGTTFRTGFRITGFLTDFVGAIFFCTTTLIVVTLLASGFFVVVETLVVLLATAVFEMLFVVFDNIVVGVVDAVAPTFPGAGATVVDVKAGANVVDVVGAGEITGGAKSTGTEVEVVTIGAKVSGAVVDGAAVAAGVMMTPPPALPPEPLPGVPPAPTEVGSSLLLIAVTTAEKLVLLPFAREAQAGMS
jgi:hypothetical protein